MSPSGKKTYLSKEISEVWEHGYHTVQDLTYDSALYCAKYILKKINGDRKEEHYGGRQPEFTTMSRKPGIGHDWYQKYKNDVYNYDKIVLKDSRIFRPPRYYDELHESTNQSRMRELKLQRRKNAALNPDNCEDRRATRALLAKIKEQKFKIRSLEREFHNLHARPLGGASVTGGGSALAQSVV